MDQLVERILESEIWSEELSVPRSHQLIAPGEVERYVYFIVSGGFRIFFENGGEEYITRLAYGGEIIAALDSFISKNPTEYYIETLRSSVFKRARIEDYVEMMESNSELFEYHSYSWQQLVYQQMQREMDLLIPSPQERYERVLKRSPKLFQEVPLKYIASYMRMTPETLSRIMNS